MLAYDKRLQHLLTIAARIFAERGYHATSMRAARAASAWPGSTTTSAARWKPPFMIQDRCFAQVITGARDAVAGVEDPEARLAAFIHHHVVFFAAHMEEMKVLSHESDELEGTMRNQLRRRKRDYANLLLELLYAVPGSQVSRQTAVYALFGMINWIYTPYHPTGPLPPDRLGEEMARLFLSGFATPVTQSATPLVAH